MKKKIIYLILIILVSSLVLGSYTYQQFVGANINKSSLGIEKLGLNSLYDNETNTYTYLYQVRLNNFVFDNGSVMVISPKVLTYTIERSDKDYYKKCRDTKTKNECLTLLAQNKVKPYMINKINKTINYLKSEQERISYQLSDQELHNELQSLDIGNI